MDDGLVVSIVKFQRLRKGSIGECGRGHAHAVSESQNPARPRRRDRQHGGARGTAEAGLRSRQRQADDVQYAELGRFDNVGGQVVKSDGGGPSCEFS